MNVLPEDSELGVPTQGLPKGYHRRRNRIQRGSLPLRLFTRTHRACKWFKLFGFLFNYPGYLCILRRFVYKCEIWSGKQQCMVRADAFIQLRITFRLSWRQNVQEISCEVSGLPTNNQDL
jgi:hypothetical protein